MKKPRIEKWRLVGPVFHLLGVGFDDVRFEDGTFIRTSALEYIDFEKGEARTKNTTYLLGERK